MALINSLNTAVSGLRSQQRNIEVIGDNIANVETTAFKSSRAEFQSLLSNTISVGNSPRGFLGGINPKQIGLGTQVAAITRDFSPGSMTQTGIATDLAIDGEGFFVLRDQDGKRVYSRDGSFGLNQKKLLFDPASGFKVQGKTLSTQQIIDGNSVAGVSTTSDIKIETGVLSIANKTANARMQGNVDATGVSADSGTRFLSKQLFDVASETAKVTAFDAATKTITATAALTKPIAGAFVEITAGTGKGQIAQIRSFDATNPTKVVLVNGFATVPDATSSFNIIRPATQTTKLDNLATSEGGASPAFTKVFNNLNKTVTVKATKGDQILRSDFVVGDAPPVGGTTLEQFAGFLRGALGINNNVAQRTFSFPRIAPDGILVGTDPTLPGSQINPAVSGTADSVSNLVITDNNHLVNGVLTTIGSLVPTPVGANTFVEVLSGPLKGRVAKVTNVTGNAITINPLDAGTAPNSGLPLQSTDSLGSAFDYRIIQNPTFNAVSKLVTTPGTTLLNNGTLDTAPDVINTTTFTDFDVNFEAVGVKTGDFFRITDTGSALFGQEVRITSVSNNTITYEPLITNPGAQITAAKPFITYEIRRNNGVVNGTVTRGQDDARTDQLKDIFGQVGGDDFVKLGVKAGDYLRWNTGKAAGQVARITEVNPSTGALTGVNAITHEPMTVVPDFGDTYEILTQADVRVDQGGFIEVAGNAGEANHISRIDLEAGGGLIQIFKAAPEIAATGSSARTSMEVFDSTGSPHNVTLTFVRQSTRSNGPSDWQWFAEADDNFGPTIKDRVVGSGVIQFGADGQFLTPTTAQSIKLDLSNQGVVTTQSINLDFSRLTQFDSTRSEVVLHSQDGFAKGTLETFDIASDGVVRGHFTNGLTRELAQVTTTKFDNQQGLLHDGGNLYRESINSGVTPGLGTPGLGGLGQVLSGFLEESNVDLSSEFTDLIVGQRAFQANARTIGVSDEMLQELVNLV